MERFKNAFRDLYRMNQNEFQLNRIRHGLEVLACTVSIVVLRTITSTGMISLELFDRLRIVSIIAVLAAEFLYTRFSKKNREVFAENPDIQWALAAVLVIFARLWISLKL